MAMKYPGIYLKIPWPTFENGNEIPWDIFENTLAYI
jgi:hypothetical protein